MLDTIAYIPTILAYAFIGLLVVILCFIVVYISHKLYGSVYDYLPTPRPMLVSLLNSQEEVAPHKSRKSTLVFLKNEASFNRKYKTALRFIVSLEPSYLAYVVFETEKFTSTHPDPLMNISFSDFRKHTLLVKYYDRLTMIPMGRMMQKCDGADLNIQGSHFPHTMEAAAQTQKALAPQKTATMPSSDSNSTKYVIATQRSLQGNGIGATTAGRPTATFASALNALAQTGNRPARPPSSP